jgi:hypothetical protein
MVIRSMRHVMAIVDIVDRLLHRLIWFSLGILITLIYINSMSTCIGRACVLMYSTPFDIHKLLP